MAKRPHVVVVGGGLAGLSAVIRLVEKGMEVTVVSVTPCKRSHSVCAQGGINAAVNLKGEDDSPIIHAYDTIKGGDFLANQPPVVEMCLAGPSIINLLDRMGCPFNRTSEGNLDFRRFGGTLYNRTAFCGASTGQQLLYALDEQVRRFETKGFVHRMEHHEFLRLVMDQEGKSRGIVFLDLFNLSIGVLKADAVVIATGGPGLIFKKSTNSTFCTGAANGRLYQQGMWYANGEFIQVHPTAIPGKDKLRLMSESARGEGGRIWVYGNSSLKIKGPDGKEIPCGVTGEPWYFLEELYPAYGNLVARDVASREVLRVCEMGLGINGEKQVYLDVTHLPHEKLHKLKAILDIYEKFTGEDPKKVPMKIYPAVHYSMGGAWVDWPAADDPDRSKRYRQMTNIPGCFNVGESDYQFHGANRLGANSLLSCIFAGLVAGVEVPRYLTQVSELNEAVENEIFSYHQAEEEKRREELFAQEGNENIYALHNELSEVMVENMTVKRSNPSLEKTYATILELLNRLNHVSLPDKSRFANQSFIFANQFRSMLQLALVMTKGALLRNEFRGAHFKEGYPERDDQHFLKTTVAAFDPITKEPKIFYQPVDTRHFPPELRDYTKAKKGKPEIHNLPNKIELPL
jgi:succinate dehydrogenase / fumarate reductase flavoprotein subunit